MAFTKNKNNRLPVNGMAPSNENSPPVMVENLSVPDNLIFIPYITTQGVGVTFMCQETKDKIFVSIAPYVEELDSSSYVECYRTMPERVMATVSINNTGGNKFDVRTDLNGLQQELKAFFKADSVDLEGFSHHIESHGKGIALVSSIAINFNVKPEPMASRNAAVSRNRPENGFDRGVNSDRGNVAQPKAPVRTSPLASTTLEIKGSDVAVNNHSIVTSIQTAQRNIALHTKFSKSESSDGKPIVRFVVDTFSNGPGFLAVNLPYADGQSIEEQAKKFGESLKDIMVMSINSRSFLERRGWKDDDGYHDGLDSNIVGHFGSEKVEGLKIAPYGFLDMPTSLVLRELVEKGLVANPDVKVDSRVTGQYVYDFGKVKIVTTGVDEAVGETWKTRPPAMWINKTSGGKVNGNASTIIDYLSKQGILELPQGVDAKTYRSSVFKDINNRLTKDESTQRWAHSVGKAGGFTKVKMVNRQIPSAPNARVFNLTEYMSSRKITDNVINHVLSNEDSVYPTYSGWAFKCGITSQLFNEGRDGRVGKLFPRGAITSAQEHIISGKNGRKMVLGEAIMDVYSFLSLVDLSGGDINDYSAVSLMSAGNVPSWFESKFSIGLPDDESESGYLLDVEYEKVEKQDVAAVFDELLLDDKSGQSFKEMVFVDDGSPRSKASLFVLKEMLKQSELDVSLNVVSDRNRRFNDWKNSDKIVFDRTNVFRTLTENMIKFDPRSLSFTQFEKTVTHRPIVSDEDKLEALSRIKSVTGDDGEFVIAFDNDIAGLSKTIPTYSFLSQIGYPVSVVIPPFAHKSDLSITTKRVYDSIQNVLSDSPDDISEIAEHIPYSPNLLVNDINDYLKLCMSGGADPKAMSQALLNQMTLSEDSTNSMLTVASELVSIFEAQKVAIKSKYPEPYKLSKEINELRLKLSSYRTPASQKKGIEYNISKLNERLSVKVNSLPDHVVQYMVTDPKINFSSDDVQIKRFDSELLSGVNKPDPVDTPSSQAARKPSTMPQPRI